MNSSWILTGALFLANLGFFLLWAVFTCESRREQEPRAPKVGWAGMGVHALLAVLILAWPASRVPLAWLFGLLLACGFFFLLPIPGRARSLGGAAGYLARDGSAFEPVDERDSMFTRNRSLRPGQSIHRLVRFVLRRSLPAQQLFPRVDNLLYGRRWRPREPPDGRALTVPPPSALPFRHTASRTPATRKKRPQPIQLTSGFAQMSRTADAP